jgi:hypothetical protein
MWSDQIREGLAETAADLRAAADMHEALGMLPAAELGRWRDAADMFDQAASGGEVA